MIRKILHKKQLFNKTTVAWEISADGQKPLPDAGLSGLTNFSRKQMIQNQILLFNMRMNGFKMITASSKLPLFRISSENKSGSGSAPVKGKQTLKDRSSDENGFILCRQCRRVITHCSAQIMVEGQHAHTFANPHGIVFEIGCFKSADGCDPIGPSSIEFCWFPGYCWQITECRFCQTHLGWIFSSNHNDSFFGLIIDRLILPDGV
jgi:hypothetical protein